MEVYLRSGKWIFLIDRSNVELEKDEIIAELIKAGVFSGENVYRTVSKKKIDDLLLHGTDRTEERGFSYWLNRNKHRGEDKSVACKWCGKRYGFDDVVRDISNPFEKRLIIECPFQEIVQVNNSYVEHWECPTYMAVAGGPRVIYGNPRWEGESDEEIIETFLSPKTSLIEECRQKLIYDSNKMKPFDLERYIFKEGIKPVQALKRIITVE